MILNIHGYEGSSENSLYTLMRELFPEKEIISPQLDYDALCPLEIRRTLENLLSDDVELIVGTSLGGFFALDLWAKAKTTPTFLFNAPIKPWEVFPRLGYANEQWLDEFRAIHGDILANAGDKDKLYAVYGKQDDVLLVKRDDGSVDDYGHRVFVSTDELCLNAKFSGIEVEIDGHIGWPINVGRFDCGHSAGENPKIIEMLKENILTWRNNEYSITRARNDENDYYMSEIVLSQKEIIIQMAECLNCPYSIIDGAGVGEVLEEGVTAQWGRDGFTTIWFSGDDITELPEQTGSLTSLETLILEYTQISKLPESIGNLQNLEVLYLTDVEISELPGSMRHLVKLKKLDISGSAIKELPEWIGELRFLEQMDISNTEIAKLPESIGTLFRLQAINAAQTPISELPIELGKLTKLTHLNITDTNISVLPEWVGELPELGSLFIGRTKIMDFSQSFSNLRSLDRLGLQGLKIRELPEWIRNNRWLHYLNISQTEITSLPDWVSEFGHLRKLNICGTGIRDLPEALKNKPGLTILEGENEF